MGIYNFSFERDKPRRNKPSIPIPPQPKEHLLDRKPERLPDPIQNVEMIDEDINVDVEQVTRVLETGLRLQDEGIKNFFSDMRVPDKTSGSRKVRVVIAGGDKAILMQKEMSNGRVELPVASIKRGNVEDNPAKFSPPYLSMDRKYHERGRKIELIYRPKPVNINYDVTVWTMSKREAEHILYQVMSRFNPMAQWVVEGAHHRGVVDAHFNGYSDSTDIDVSPSDRRHVRYDYTFRVEGWLPLPTKIVPGILGNVSPLEVTTGEIIQQLKNRGQE